METKTFVESVYLRGRPFANRLLTDRLSDEKIATTFRLATIDLYHIICLHILIFDAYFYKRRFLTWFFQVRSKKGVRPC